MGREKKRKRKGKRRGLRKGIREKEGIERERAGNNRKEGEKR